MPNEVKLPRLGQTMQEGTIVTIRVNVGDQVSAGDVLFDIETDKATMEIESPSDGVVTAIPVEVGQTIPVNAPLLILSNPDEQNDSQHDHHRSAKRPQTVGAGTDSFKQTCAASTPAPEAATTKKTCAPPHAATLAQDMEVDLAGTSPADALRKVEAEIHQTAQETKISHEQRIEDAPAYTFGQKIPLNRLHRIVAEKMLWSKQNIPCFYLNIRADMTRLVALRTKLNKTAPIKLSFNDFILRALTLGMRHYPVMTGQLDGDHIQLAATLDFGLAIATDDGLIAPIVRDCGTKSVYDIAAYCNDLIDRTRTGTLSLDDLEGGCITVSNLGGLGIESFIPIVVPGQTSILGVGAITDTAVPSDGNMLVRKMMNLTLSVDHKVVNGAEAAQFLDFAKKHLEHPDTLI